MSFVHAILNPKISIGEALLNALPGDRRKVKDLAHGWYIMSASQQIASGYISDNAPWHAVEFALNQNLLADLPSERVALMRWLEYQKKRFGGREAIIHQRGNPVHWYRIGFASDSDARIFLYDFFLMRRQIDVRARWVLPKTDPVDSAPAVQDQVITNDALVFVSNAITTSAAAELLADKSEQNVPVVSDMGAEEDRIDEGKEHVGNLSNEDYAHACIPVLVDHVLRQTDEVMETLTYEDMARRLNRINKHGYPAARGLGVVLGRAMELIDCATAHYSVAPPYLTTVVVAKNGPSKGLPGVGVSERWYGYDQLTQSEKADRVEAEYQKIIQFGSRWNDVLYQSHT